MRVLITGASRGIGAAIATAFASNYPGVQIALVGRSLSNPSHKELKGTLLDTARVVESLGATALPIKVDISDPECWKQSLRGILHSFGGLDVLVNNASMLSVEADTSLKNMNLLYAVNTRATLMANQFCKQSLEESGGAIVTMSPPIHLGRLEYISEHPAYTVSKYGMSLATIGTATLNLRANCLWPRRMVRTAATNLLEKKGLVDGAFSHGRDPSLVAQAVYDLAVKKTHLNARMLLDEDVIDMPPCEAPLDAFVESATTHSHH